TASSISSNKDNGMSAGNSSNNKQLSLASASSFTHSSTEARLSPFVLTSSSSTTTSSSSPFSISTPATLSSCSQQQQHHHQQHVSSRSGNNNGLDDNVGSLSDLAISASSSSIDHAMQDAFSAADLASLKQHLVDNQ